MLIQVILVDMLKGNREKIGVRSYEKAEKVEPGKVKQCILEARQAHSGSCMLLVIAKLKFIISVTVGDKLARESEAKKERGSPKERNDLAFFTLNKGKGKEQSAVKRKSCGKK
jgi:hypothetical protein